MCVCGPLHRRQMREFGAQKRYSPHTAHFNIRVQTIRLRKCNMKNVQYMLAQHALGTEELVHSLCGGIAMNATNNIRIHAPHTK